MENFNNFLLKAEMNQAVLEYSDQKPQMIRLKKYHCHISMVDERGNIEFKGHTIDLDFLMSKGDMFWILIGENSAICTILNRVFKFDNGELVNVDYQCRIDI